MWRGKVLMWVYPDEREHIRQWRKRVRDAKAARGKKAKPAQVVR